MVVADEHVAQVGQLHAGRDQTTRRSVAAVDQEWDAVEHEQVRGIGADAADARAALRADEDEPVGAGRRLGQALRAARRSRRAKRAAIVRTRGDRAWRFSQIAHRRRDALSFGGGRVEASAALRAD
ncbi:MAG: hypothetical protein V9G24_04135 [Rhodoblastus sp.]